MKKAYAIVASIILIYFGFISATFAAALGALDISDHIYDDTAQVFSFDMYEEYMNTYYGHAWHQDAAIKAPDKHGVQAPIVSAGLELNSFRNYGPFANYQTAANPLQDGQFDVSNEAETASALSESAVTLLIGAVMIGLSGLLRKRIHRQEAKRSQSTAPTFTPVFSGTKKLY
jgi:hypothetical protein